jgi:hypothetical protein
MVRRASPTGLYDPSFTANWTPATAISSTDGAEVRLGTVLTGDVRDQAQLHGCIERFEELGLELLEVQQTR